MSIAGFWKNKCKFCSRLLKRSGVSRLRRDSGVVAVVFALLLPVLIGATGLVLDLGFAFHHKRSMQTATDAAAVAGAVAIIRQEEAGTLNSMILSDAGRNGFDGSEGETRTINWPPVSGEFAGNDMFVEVTISENLSTHLMPVLGVDDMTVTSRAVAGAVAAKTCVFVLNGTASKALNASSESSFLAADCGIKVHSCDQEALSVTSNSTMTADAIDVCGQANTSGSTMTPTPVTGSCEGTPCDRGEDPLLYLADPVVPGGCDQTDFKTSSQGGVGNRYQIYAGTYCNGLSAESGSHVNFNPGVYYLKGGGLGIDSNSSATGFGVTFYNTETNDYAYAPIAVQSGSHVELTATVDTDTDFDGILFWQDRNITGAYDNKVESDNTSYFEGTFYFPTQRLMFHSNSVGENGAVWTLVVVDTLDVTSGTTLTLRSNVYGFQPIMDPVLVE